jgi:hypothetical protein
VRISMFLNLAYHIVFLNVLNLSRLIPDFTCSGVYFVFLCTFARGSSLFLMSSRLSDVIHGSDYCLIFITLFEAMSSGFVLKSDRNFSYAS